MAFYTYFEITKDYALIKFDSAIRADTLVNANFTVTKDDATPVTTIVNPFRTINLTSDWVSVSRSLYLWWNVSLEADAEYSIHVNNLKNAITGATISGRIEFETEAATTPTVEDRPTRDPIEVEDYSIKNPPPIGGDDDGPSLPGESGTLTVVGIVPDVNHGYYMEHNDGDGKITVEFNQSPAANYITPQDFRLQKKLVTTGLSKWVNVDTVVAAETLEPKVNIYLPSTDATPVYSFQTSMNDDYEYWETGYQYRLTISKNVGI